MTDKTKPTTREAALDLIAATACEGPSGNVGGTLAEDILKALEAGGFSFATAKALEEEFDPPHRSYKAHR